MVEEIPEWMQTVDQLLSDPHCAQRVIIKFPVYRTDLARQISERYGLHFYDFREEYMACFGAGAGSLSVRQLTEQVDRLAGKGETLVHNVEAMLSTVNEQERVQWFERFLRGQGRYRIVLPLYIFGSSVKSHANQICEIKSGLIPEQTLVSRLANQ